MSNNYIFIMVILIAALVLWRRTRSMYRPIKGNGIRILIPVLFLLPAVNLLLEPNVHIDAKHGILAACFGLVLSIPLIWTTNYEVREDGLIYAQKNKMFIVAIIAVLAARLVFRQQLDGMDPLSLSALFLIVAICYIIPWRVISYIKFIRVRNAQQPPYSE